MEALASPLHRNYEAPVLHLIAMLFVLSNCGLMVAVVGDAGKAGWSRWKMLSQAHTHTHTHRHVLFYSLALASQKTKYI